MNSIERADFLEQRSLGIGGSDIASLLQPFLSEVRYGCRRRLWYDKSRIPPDYPQDDEGPMQLGRILEPHIAQWHSEATGDILTECGPIRHPDHPELQVNIDRLIQNDAHDTQGVGEIKAFGPDMFWKTKREGIIADYLLQLQHGMLCAGLPWGKFIVGNRAYGHTVSNPPLAWEHAADTEIHEAIVAEGPAFWRTLTNIDAAPARLDPDDRRCSSCQWRQSCQGAALIEQDARNPDDLPIADDLLPLLTALDDLNELLTERTPDGKKCTSDELLILLARERIKDAMGDREAVLVPMLDGRLRKLYHRYSPGKVSWETEQMAVKYEALRREHGTDDPDFPPYETFKRQGVPYRTFRSY